MATFLSMDGVDDYLQLPFVTFNELTVDLLLNPSKNSTIFDSRDTLQYGNLQLIGGNYRFGGWSKIYESGVEKGFNTAATLNQRIVIKAIPPNAINDDVTFFKAYSGAFDFLRGYIYSITLKENGITKAHYDMTTGTVQDQSGNGKHATLFGGTWLDDGIGNEPQGTDVSLNYSMSQRLYKDTAITSATKQLLFANRTANHATKQTLFADKSISHATKQTIYKDASTAFNLKNVIYADRSINYAMLQTFFNEGIQRSTNFAMNIAIYRDGQQTHAMRQELYRAIQDHADLKQVMYADQQFDGTLRQEIHRQLSQNVAMLQRMYDDKQSDYPLLVKLLAEYKVYNQIVEREMFICRKVDGDTKIARVISESMRI